MTWTASIAQRIDLLEENIAHLEAMQRRALDELRGDPIARAALERFVEVSVQAMIDIGNRIIAERRWKGVDAYSDVFVRLAEQGVLEQSLGTRLIQAAGIRNRLAHEYLTVELDILHGNLGLAIADMKQFVRAVYAELDRLTRRGAR